MTSRFACPSANRTSAAHLPWAAVHEKARAEQLVEDARKAVQSQAPLDRVRALTAELQQVYHSLGSTPGDTGAPPPQPGEKPAGGDDDVIDADFTVS